MSGVYQMGCIGPARRERSRRQSSLHPVKSFFLLMTLASCASSPSGPKDSADPPGPADGDVDGDADVDGGVDDTGSESCWDASPTIEVGTGETTFERLDDGDPVVMVHGPQGGWHMLGSVRIHSMESIIDVSYTITDEASGVRVSDNTYRVAVVVDGECTGFYPGMYGYLTVDEMGTPGRPPDLLSYKTLEMKMDVTDYGDRTASKTVRVVAQPDPVDVGSSDGEADL